MAAPTSASDLLDLVQQSLPLDPSRLGAYIADLRRAAALPAGSGDLAALLIRDGFLTPFQADHLMRGRRPKFLIGKYLILDRIGAGGMGAVYFCEHLQLGRQVALKVLPADQADDPAALARFHREAHAVAALDHPNIVRAYDVDVEGRTHFLVMEYVDGADLQELVAHRGRLDPARAAHYVRQTADGLQHAHAARLVHRDVKPANLLLARNGVVKILDLGLARFFHEDAGSVTGQDSDKNILGTADYVAPEQARDSSDVDIRADIYSLGVTFYFLLAGRAPFADGTLNQKLLWHQMKTPPPVRKLRPEVPEAMAAVVARMMAKAPAARYQTPAEVATALAPWTRSPPAPPSPSELPSMRPTITAGRPWRTGLPSAGSTEMERPKTAVTARVPTPPPTAALSSMPVAVPLATPIAALPPLAQPASPLPAEDDWSRLFDDTDPRKASAPRRSEKRPSVVAAGLRKHWRYFVGAGAGVLLLVGGVWLVLALLPAGPRPSPPLHLRATMQGSNAIDLTWQDASGASTGFRVERATDLQFTKGLLNFPVGRELTYTDSRLAPGATYYYRVRALRGSAESGASNTAWAPPSCPLNGFTTTGLVLNGAAVTDKLLRLTDSKALPVLGASTAGMLASPLSQAPLLAASALFPGRTDSNASEARSAFYRQGLDIRAFRTKFRFRIGAGPQTADGFTFCIQGGEPTLVGQPGGGLGYQGIPKSVAVKFDLWDNDGEGPNSTGLFRNGVKPSNHQSKDLTPSGVDLHSGRPYDAAIDYKDGKLTLLITDGDDPSKKFSTTFAVDIPITVGGSTACVGFTGATGGMGAVQDVLSWSWESTGTGD